MWQKVMGIEFLPPNDKAVRRFLTNNTQHVVKKKHNISDSRSKEHVWSEMCCLLPKTWSQLVQAYSTKKAWVCVMIWPWRLNPMDLRHQPIGWSSCHNKIIQLSTYATSIGVLSQKHQQIGCSEGLSEICPWHTFDSWWGEFPNLRYVQVGLLEANGWKLETHVVSFSFWCWNTF